MVGASEEGTASETGIAVRIAVRGNPDHATGRDPDHVTATAIDGAASVRAIAPNQADRDRLVGAKCMGEY
jgi:hypothetical protein